MISMVGHKTSLLSQSHTIDTMRLKDIDGQVARHGNNHQRHKQIIATGNLSNEEDTRQRSMHHTRHHTSHTQQGEVLLRYIDTNLVHIP